MSGRCSDSSKRTGFLCWSGLLLLLNGCGGYQAPVSEQGARQDLQPPLIVDSSTPESSFYLPRGSASVATPTAEEGGVTAPAVSARVAGAGATHRVRDGDTLFSIAYQYDLDFRSLAIANSLSPPYTIFVGQDINLDLERVSNNQRSTASRLGTPVNNNAVAQAQASINRAGGLLRQTIGNVTAREPNWRWPHGGNIIRGFDSTASKGIDLAGRVGDPVLAAGDGDVVYSGRGVQGSGNLIIIRHNDRYLSAYAHNRVMLVTEGAQVRSGEQIAEVGESPGGVAMLHFEIRIDGKSVDPLGLLPGR